MSGARAGREAIRGITDPGMRDAVRELVGQGWAVLRWTGKRHLLLEHPTGARVTASCTTRDGNAYKTFLQNARRAVRQSRRQS